MTIHLPEDTSITTLSSSNFVKVWTAVKRLVSYLNESITPMRYAAGTDGKSSIQLFPIQPITAKWKPITAGEPRFYESYGGFLSSANGPRAESSDLEDTQRRITRVTGWTTPLYDFPDPDDTNLFAKLVRGEIPQWRVWEDEEHVAFLTPFANTAGLTVLIPRRHLSSNILSLEDGDFIPLMEAAWKVSHFIREALQVEQVGMFAEGFEIDYAHVKIIPVPVKRVKPVQVGEYFDKYPGYLTTQFGPTRQTSELQTPAGFTEVRQKWLQSVNL
jgi:diadenosine tetraphosphate (Ap4A) HIT family hydrolase